MSRLFIQKAFIFLVLFLMFGCETKIGDTSDITGQLTSFSDCKNQKAGEITAEIADSLSCVNYSYNLVNNKLLITHINAGFNCCPENLYCIIYLKNDTIIIQEYEEAALCDCNCLYDLDIEINGIVAQQYQIKFIEPYAQNQEDISFSINLKDKTEGSYCVTRKQYPWGIY